MSMKVMVIDPDWRFANQAATMLESHAHLVVHEPRAKEALSRAASWQPDLVILAAELAEGLIQPLSSLPAAPAVLLTSWMDRYDLAWRAWQKGGHELLMKPVLDSRELHAAIVTAMENAATGARRPKTVAASA